MQAFAANRVKKFFLTFYRLLLCLAVTALFFSCKKSGTWIEVDPAFSQYIDAYTTGIVSKTTAVRIQLAGTANTVHTVGEEVKENLFSFSPSVNGKALWVDASTIEFKPTKFLKPDQLYEVSFSLGKVTKTIPKFRELKFNLKTVKPAFSVSDYGLRSTGTKNKMMLTGNLETADIEQGKSVEQLLVATQNNKSLPIKWQHNDAAKMHTYSIDGIKRLGNSSNLTIAWNGKPINMDLTGEKLIAVPAAGDFVVLNVMAMNEAQQYASVQFSDPIAVGQDLTGLISISNQSDISYTINGSEVKVFSNGKLDGNYTVNINSGIKNTWGDILNKGFTANVNFENKMPSVKIQGKGNILPNSGRLVLPFEAVNLRAVDISIIKIYENNVPRFLQDNSMDGNNYLRKVAKPVVQKTIMLDDDKTLDLHKRQHFSLDIDKFLKTEQGAIYRVTFGFRPSYSLYTIADTSQKNSVAEDEENDSEYYGDEDDNAVDEDDVFWKSYDSYYPFGYNWQRRDDPNSKSYYNKDRWATRNILASNIGLTAKRGNDNRLIVAVSNILSTEPMAGVEIEVMDYQQNLISKGKSSSDGFAEIEIKRKPFLLIAKKGNERGYLKLDDGSSLALSHFDVSGEEVKNGIKGFIF